MRQPPTRPADWPPWLTAMRCPTCDAPLRWAGGTPSRAPTWPDSAYRCPNAHDWLQSELRPAPLTVTQEALPL